MLKRAYHMSKIASPEFILHTVFLAIVHLYNRTNAQKSPQHSLNIWISDHEYGFQKQHNIFTVFNKTTLFEYIYFFIIIILTDFYSL